MANDQIDSGILAAQRRFASKFSPFDPMTLPPAEGRQLSAAAATFWNDGTPRLPYVREYTIAGPAGSVLARYYGPPKGPLDGAILYIHGGGWTFGSLDSHDRIMRCLALETGVPVIGVDYRLAPEHPYPAALQDCRAAWRWLLLKAPSLAVDPARITIAGDSSGANLALSLCLAERDCGGIPPAALGLFYGCFAPVFDTESHRLLGDGRFGLSTERMRWYWSNYLGGRCSNVPLFAAPLFAAPLWADFNGLPSIYLSLGELDPLADDTRQLAAKLSKAGVDHVIDAWPGAVHGFMQMTRDVPLAQAAVSKAALHLRSSMLIIHAARDGHGGAHSPPSPR